MNPAPQPQPHPFRDNSADSLPAPSIEQLARERLLSLVVGLACLHFVLALAFMVDTGATEIRSPSALFHEGTLHRASAWTLALATGVFFLVLRLLLPRLPLRWAEPLGALTAMLLAMNALCTFALGVSPGKTTVLILAVIGSSALLFSQRTLLLVFVVVGGGWLGTASQAGWTSEWAYHGVALFGAAIMAAILQRLQRRSIRLMLRASTAPAAPAITKLDNEEHFRRWYEAAFEGIAIHERGAVIEANQALATLLHRELQELPGSNVLDWFTRASRDLIQESLLLGTFRPFEAVAVRTDNSEVHLELFSKRIPYRGRDVTVTAFRDVTERRRASIAAAAEQERLEAGYHRQLALANLSARNGDPADAAPLLECIVQTAAVILPARAGGVILVIEDGQWALAAAHLPPRTRELGFEPVRQLLRACEWVTEHGRPFVSANTAQDDPFDVNEGSDLASAYAALPLLAGPSVTGILVALDAGAPRHFTPQDLDFLADLAARAAAALTAARLQAGLQEANRLLQQQHRLLHRQNEELLLTRLRAEQAGDAKSKFLARISHELRNPLNGVVGMTDYLLTTGLTADQRESADHLRASADALLASINTIHEFARNNSGPGVNAPAEAAMAPRIESNPDLAIARSERPG